MKVALALAVPVLVYAAPFLFTSRCLHSADFVAYHEARATLARDTYRATGEMPRWDPRVYAGTPFVGNFEMSMAYPPNRLFLFLEPVVAWEIYATLHLLLAAWGMYRLTRAFHLRPAACATAALAYGLSFAAIGRIGAGHVSVLSAYAWLPWLAYAIVRLTARPTVASTLLLAIVCAALFAGGLPQFVYLAGLVGLALVLWRARTRHAWAGLVAGTALGLLLAASHLLPALDLVRETTRGATADVYRGAAPDPQHVMLKENFASIIVPHFPWTETARWRMFRDLWHEKAMYVGILPLMAAALSLFSRRRAPVLFFAAVGAVALAVTIPPLTRALSALPLYGAFRVPARFVTITVLCLSVLSAFGLDAILRADVPRRRWVAGTLGIVCAIGGGAVYLKYAHEVYVESLVLVGLAGASALVLLGAPKLAPLLAAADLCFFGIAIQPRVAPERYAPAPWYDRYVGPERADYRICDLTQSRTFDLAPARVGFRLINAWGYPIPKSAAELYARAWRVYDGPKPDALGVGRRLEHPEVLQRLNVRWYVAKFGPLRPTWREVAREGGLTLYEDPDARPLAPVPWTRPESHRIELAPEPGEARRLTVSETYLPGWTAEADGRPVPVQSEDGLIAVDVPAGAARVVLEYTPPLRTLGRLLTMGGVLAAATLAGLAAARRKNRAAA